MQSFIIDGIKYTSETTAGSKLRIVCNMDRGLTFVGKFDLDEEGDFYTIADARCVIRFGTSKHIAELADKGPQANTKLGHAYPVRIPKRTVAFIYDCGEGWA